MPSSGGKKCALDRKSTRLNSSHTIISYAVFCLKKKTINVQTLRRELQLPTRPQILFLSAPAPRALIGVCSLLVRLLPAVRLSFRLVFFNDTATAEIYTLSLHDALPI